MEDFEKRILEEKFSDFLPSYMLNYDNHTNFSYASNCSNITELNMFCLNENFNFLGIAKPPYNPYGKEFDFAVVFEDTSNNYEIIWHHCSRSWINQFRAELSIESL